MAKKQAVKNKLKSKLKAKAAGLIETKKQQLQAVRKARRAK